MIALASLLSVFRQNPALTVAEKACRNCPTAIALRAHSSYGAHLRSAAIRQRAAVVLEARAAEARLAIVNRALLGIVSSKTADEMRGIACQAMARARNLA